MKIVTENYNITETIEDNFLKIKLKKKIQILTHAVCHCLNSYYSVIVFLLKKKSCEIG